jgi:hypothetical protein
LPMNPLRRAWLLSGLVSRLPGFGVLCASARVLSAAAAYVPGRCDHELYLRRACSFSFQVLNGAGSPGADPGGEENPRPARPYNTNSTWGPGPRLPLSENFLKFFFGSRARRRIALKRSRGVIARTTVALHGRARTEGQRARVASAGAKDRARIGSPWRVQRIALARPHLCMRSRVPLLRARDPPARPQSSHISRARTTRGGARERAIRGRDAPAREAARSRA